jgi:hypothetical protein
MIWVCKLPPNYIIEAASFKKIMILQTLLKPENDIIIFLQIPTIAHFSFEMSKATV